MDIRATPEFAEWLLESTAHERARIDDRLDRISEHHHFGDHKHLGDDLLELRWRSGCRIYYALIQDAGENVALLLLGGNKNGQKRDIARARKILEREAP